MSELFGSFHWSDLIFDLVHLGLAYLLALPIAWDREKSERNMGLRTFPLVAVASCGFVLIARLSFGAEPEPMARVIQGLMTGIGFIGGGAILKNGAIVSGTATAASIWSTGAVGAAVALDRVEIAVALSLVTFATLRLLTPLKREEHRSNERQPAGD